MSSFFNPSNITEEYFLSIPFILLSIYLAIFAKEEVVKKITRLFSLFLLSAIALFFIIVLLIWFRGFVYETKPATNWYDELRREQKKIISEVLLDS